MGLADSRYSIEDLQGIMVYFADTTEGVDFDKTIPCPDFDIHKFDYEYVPGTKSPRSSAGPRGSAAPVRAWPSHQQSTTSDDCDRPGGPGRGRAAERAMPAP